MASIKFPAAMLDTEIRLLCKKNPEYGKISVEAGIVMLESDGLRYESFDDLEVCLRSKGIPFDRFTNGSDSKETVEGLLCYRPDVGDGEYYFFVRTYGGHVMVRSDILLSILERKEPCQTLLEAIKEYVLAEGHRCSDIQAYV